MLEFVFPKEKIAARDENSQEEAEGLCFPCRAQYEPRLVCEAECGVLFIWSSLVQVLKQKCLHLRKMFIVNRTEQIFRIVKWK